MNPSFKWCSFNGFVHTCNYTCFYKHNKTAIASLLLFRWSERWDSNPRPLGPEPSALPSCATSRICLEL